jgi:DNA-binding winged helix-turn-helix (wHTH) protein
VQFSFAGHMLDSDRRELRRGSEPIPVEPQVFDVLVYLLENRDRVVSKDDLIASVWGGRIVSDSTLTSRINAARKAIGDSGEEQRLIRTIARKGIRFVAEVTEGQQRPLAASPAGGGPDPTTKSEDESGRHEPLTSALRRASIAVMPFVDQSNAARIRGGAADALAHDVITRLAKLRSLFVIAQGTVFALRERGIGPEEAGRVLRVDYIATSAEQIVERIARALTPATRIVALTWVHSSTGLKLPLRLIADALNEVNATRAEATRVLFCVDGVHGFGVEDVVFLDLGCDFFVAGCHKWLFGPRGTGIVAGSQRGWEAVLPTIPSFSDSETWQAWASGNEPSGPTTRAASRLEDTRPSNTSGPFLRRSHSTKRSAKPGWPGAHKNWLRT